jgi:hypothetical protein
MASKLIALKHILQAMPVFHLMILDFTQHGYNQLESLCRVFLWGSAESGKPKVPLIAWPKIVRSKPTGGLGLINFRSHSAVLKIQSVSQVLNGHQAE